MDIQATRSVAANSLQQDETKEIHQRFTTRRD